MVDYTKPAMRDESWRRWKGGSKLAKDLNAFYTAKRATDRIAWHNSQAGLSAGSKPSANGDLLQSTRREALKAFLMGEQRGQTRGWPGIVERAKAAVAAAPAAGMPGQDGPKR